MDSFNRLNRRGSIGEVQLQREAAETPFSQLK